MSGESDDLELPEVLVKLRAEHGVSTTYHLLWKAVVEGRVPAHRVGKRWKVRPNDTPQVAVVLGVQPSAVAA
jgi:hypothetical protein